MRMSHFPEPEEHISSDDSANGTRSRSQKTGLPGFCCFDSLACVELTNVRFLPVQTRRDTLAISCYIWSYLRNTHPTSPQTTYASTCSESPPRRDPSRFVDARRRRSPKCGRAARQRSISERREGRWLKTETGARWEKQSQVVPSPPLAFCMPLGWNRSVIGTD